MSPLNGKAWEPPLGQAPTEQQREKGPVKRAATPLGPHPDPPALREVDVNNHRQHGFNKLPPCDLDFGSWKLDKLKEFLSVSPRNDGAEKRV